MASALGQLNQLGLPKAHPNMRNINNPVVFFDVSINNAPAERVVFELYADVCPKTAENFRQFCTGEHTKSGIPIGYKNSIIHRVITGFMIQGGDFVSSNGKGRASIFGGEVFDDENFTLSHSHPGLLAMANSGPNTNGCQWYITLANCDWLDGKHVVFGQVLQGLLTIRKIEQVPVGVNNKPKLNIVITQCGEL